MNVLSEAANLVRSPAEGLFLAATSLKSTWPAGGPDVFLGDWCFRYPEDEQLARHARIATYPWGPPQARIDGSEYCQALTRRIAVGLAPFFSALLDDELDQRCATLLLAPTVIMLTGTAYHQFLCLKTAREQFGALRSAGLRREDFVVPKTNERLAGEYWSDGFQLQILSAIAPQLGIPLILHSREELAVKPGDAAATDAASASPQMRRDLAGRWLRRIAKDVLRLASLQASCVMYRSSFSSAESLAVAALSGLRIAPLPLVRLDSVSWPSPSAALRGKLAGQVAAILDATPFEKALGEILPALWPISLLEGIEKLKKVVAGRFPRRPKTISSAEGWACDDAFKLWCVQSIKRGSRLVSCQHGGCYGMRRPFSMGEQIEYAVVDKFISWGGSVPVRSCVTLPVPPHFLTGRAQTDGGYLLYVGTAEPPWPVTLHYGLMGSMFPQYLERQIAFLRALPAGLRSRVLLRPSRDDLGWSIAQRLRHAIPDVAVDDFSRSFNERLSEAKVVVIDYFGSTFTQSMGSAIPTVLVWDPDAWIMNDVAKVSFDDLEAAGVYFRRTEPAAAAVARIWRDPQAWWEEPKVAGPVDKLLARFFHVDRNWVGPWRRELLH